MNYLIVPGLPPKKRKTPIDKLISNTATFFDVTVEEMCSRSRKRHLVETRFFFFYYGFIACGHTLTSLSESAGRRDHTTVIHGIKTISNLAEIDPKFKDRLEKYVDYMESVKWNDLKAA